MKNLIHENERGLLFKNGKFVKMLLPGKYYTFGNSHIETLSMELAPSSELISIDQLLEDEAFKTQVYVINVPDEHIGLHFVNGQFKEALKSGRHVFWQLRDVHTEIITSIETPEIGEEVPAYVLGEMSCFMVKRYQVKSFEKGLLYYDEKLIKVLEPGNYVYWMGRVKVDVQLFDTRITQLNIVGQEILTQDKVSLRVSMICQYRICDFVKLASEVEDYEEQIHVTAQMALREYVAKYKMDEILESKEEMSAYILERLKAKEKTLYLEVVDAGVKDIILPGEIRDIMNTVLVAEKRAQANVITRREEVASTRSLLNTAKLMEENQTLFKLKQMEYIEKICEKVGSINVNGNTDLLSQLTTIVNG